MYGTAQAAVLSPLPVAPPLPVWGFRCVTHSSITTSTAWNVNTCSGRRRMCRTTVISPVRPCRVITSAVAARVESLPPPLLPSSTMTPPAPAAEAVAVADAGASSPAAAAVAEDHVVASVPAVAPSGASCAVHAVADVTDDCVTTNSSRSGGSSSNLGNETCSSTGDHGTPSLSQAAGPSGGRGRARARGQGRGLAGRAVRDGYAGRGGRGHRAGTASQAPGEAAVPAISVDPSATSGPITGHRGRSEDRSGVARRGKPGPGPAAGAGSADEVVLLTELKAMRRQVSELTALLAEQQRRDAEQRQQLSALLLSVLNGTADAAAISGLGGPAAAGAAAVAAVGGQERAPGGPVAVASAAATAAGSAPPSAPLAANLFDGAATHVATATSGWDAAGERRGMQTAPSQAAPVEAAVNPGAEAQVQAATAAAGTAAAEASTGRSVEGVSDSSSSTGGGISSSSSSSGSSNGSSGGSVTMYCIHPTQLRESNLTAPTSLQPELLALMEQELNGGRAGSSTSSMNGSSNSDCHAHGSSSSSNSNSSTGCVSTAAADAAHGSADVQEQLQHLLMTELSESAASMESDSDLLQPTNVGGGGAVADSTGSSASLSMERAATVDARAEQQQPPPPPPPRSLAATASHTSLPTTTVPVHTLAEEAHASAFGSIAAGAALPPAIDATAAPAPATASPLAGAPHPVGDSDAGAPDWGSSSSTARSVGGVRSGRALSGSDVKVGAAGAAGPTGAAAPPLRPVITTSSVGGEQLRDLLQQLMSVSSETIRLAKEAQAAGLTLPPELTQPAALPAAMALLERVRAAKAATAASPAAAASTAAAAGDVARAGGIGRAPSTGARPGVADRSVARGGRAGGVAGPAASRGAASTAGPGTMDAAVSPAAATAPPSLTPEQLEALRAHPSHMFAGLRRLSWEGEEPLALRLPRAATLSALPMQAPRPERPAPRGSN